jgi:hypothetical protein
MSSAPQFEIRDAYAVDATVFDGDSLGAQTPRLLAVVHGRFWKHDAAARAQDAMPGQIQFPGRNAQGKSRQPGAAGQAGCARHGAIGRDLAAWDHAHDIPNGLYGGTILRGGRMSRRRFAAARQQQPISRRLARSCHAF